VPSASESGDRWLLGGRWAPLGSVVQFVEAPLDAVVSTLVDWRQGLGPALDVRETTEFPQALHALEPLQTPWTAELLFAMPRGWTAYLNNGRNGGDPSVAGMLARRLDVLHLVAIHNDRPGAPHASTQLWMHGPGGEGPLKHIRSLAAYKEDGRRHWLTRGTPQAFEQPSNYERRRIRDRLTRGLLVWTLPEWCRRVVLMLGVASCGRGR